MRALYRSSGLQKRVRSCGGRASHMFAIYWPVNTFDTDVPASLFHQHYPQYFPSVAAYFQLHFPAHYTTA